MHFGGQAENDLSPAAEDTAVSPPGMNRRTVQPASLLCKAA